MTLRRRMDRAYRLGRRDGMRGLTRPAPASEDAHEAMAYTAGYHEGRRARATFLAQLDHGPPPAPPPAPDLPPPGRFERYG